jgi:uncharacterized protein
MSKQITIKILPHQANDETEIKRFILLTTGLSYIANYKILKKSIDARSKTIWVNLTIEIFETMEVLQKEKKVAIFNPIHKNAKKVVIIGAGPAGIFAALQLIQLGIQPIIIERGKDVRSRRRDLAILNKEGIINPESNYCYGEGGAGTYSDGKLYTRSNKRGNIQRILDLFVQFGAAENILYEAHPHIGTNKLPQIITAMRHCIEQNGGQFLFEKKMVDFTIKNNEIIHIHTADGDTIKGDAYILATGHSARDVFTLLHKKNILIEAKPFALGVRIEHPQEIIDAAQYKCAVRDENLPPSSYSLVHQVKQKGVFSFCMCPGGIIATASTAANELVVNGWSPSKRNNPFANSGMVVEVTQNDLAQLKNYTSFFDKEDAITSPLSMLHFQKIVEEKAYHAGGGKFVAPAQKLVDFVEKKISTSLPKASYLPGLHSSDINEVLPKFISERLAIGFKEFGKKLKGYYTNDAIIVATESRTSSPVKIPRETETLTHPQIKNLYPCGEGAGYAGGIVSACMDGERCAVQISKVLIG